MFFLNVFIKIPLYFLDLSSVKIKRHLAALAENVRKVAENIVESSCNQVSCLYENQAIPAGREADEQQRPGGRDLDRLLADMDAGVDRS